MASKEAPTASNVQVEMNVAVPRTPKAKIMTWPQTEERQFFLYVVFKYFSYQSKLCGPTNFGSEKITQGHPFPFNNSMTLCVAFFLIRAMFIE